MSNSKYYVIENIEGTILASGHDKISTMMDARKEQPEGNLICRKCYSNGTESSGISPELPKLKL